jgi:hypothetical protein
MNLATFKTSDEADYFMGSAGDFVWVGINDFVTEGTFVQVNGVPIPLLTWVPGVLEPNTADGIYRCVVSIPIGFVVYDCNRLLSFACEWYETVPCGNADQNPIIQFV